ncbi:hypothetical protein ACFQ08_17135 [Streptosporangium algeriense]|uniref:Uncharacterized protein n=1 Tax=Streptosporangium algeriense TaxID=1682748 RepID=A0ABW3DTC7_9ACTN
MAVMMVTPVVVAVPAVTTDAQATSKDPVGALKERLVENRGVRLSKTLTATKNGEKATFWSTGAAEFERGGIEASDITHRSDFKNLTSPIRHITFTGRKYVQESGLPSGKHWRRYKDKGIRPLLDSDWIRLADPIMLKAVLDTTETNRPGGVYDGTHTILYQGTISLGELYRAAPGFPFGLERKPAGKDAKAKISWRLWLGEDQLVRRAWGSWSEPFSGGGGGKALVKSYVSDTRLTGWGARTDIEPPSADEVANP